MLSRLRYAIDNAIARRPRILLLWHFLLSFGVVTLIGFVAWALQLYPKREGLLRSLWFNTVLALDPGTAQSVEADAVGVHQLITALVVAVVGVLIIGSMIAVIQNAVQDRVTFLRKGMSKVVEKDHIVILGWSHLVHSVIGDLIRSRRDDLRIVILAQHDQVWMEDRLRRRFGHERRVRIVCRTGNPVDVRSLEIVAPREAARVIVLAPDSPHPDALVIKTVLALLAGLGDDARCRHIAAEIVHTKNLEVARIAGGERVSFVPACDVIARTLVQACRQSGLALVFDELLGVDGNHIAFVDAGAVVGNSFDEVACRLTNAALIGIRTSTQDIRLGPDADRTIAAGDELVVIAKETPRFGPAPSTAPHGEPEGHGACGREEGASTLILGAAGKLPFILRELDAYATQRSRIEVVGAFADVDGVAQSMGSRLRHVAPTFRNHDTTDVRLFDEVDVAQFDHVVIVASDEHDADHADARTIMTLLNLRHAAAKAGRRMSVAIELRDVRNRAVALTTTRSAAGGLLEEFVVDDTSVAGMLTQIATRREIGPIFDELLDADGCSVYFVPACEYTAHDRAATFGQIVRAALARRELAIGYVSASDGERFPAADGRPAPVTLNPARDEARVFSADDRIIVIAER
jgi:hypothetical protein